MAEVSIIMPVYNGESYLGEAIESILTQTFQNWELLLVNDGSTDSSADIMERYAGQDQRIKLIYNRKNLYLPKSLNTGFRCANGKYLTWTSDDNRYKKDALEVMVAALEAQPSCGMVYCDMEYINGQGEVTGYFSGDLSGIYVEDPIGACFLYRREVAERVGEYDPQMILVEDYDYWLRISRQFEIVHIPNFCYQYRIHGNSLTGTRIQEIIAQLHRLRLREMDFLLERTSQNEKEVLFLDMWRYSRDEMWRRRSQFFPDGVLPEKLKWLKQLAEIGERDSSKKIILFGAGAYGRKALERYGRDRIVCFADNNPALQGKVIDGIPVISFESLKGVHKNYRIVLSASSRSAIAIAEQLVAAGIEIDSVFPKIL